MRLRVFLLHVMLIAAAPISAFAADASTSLSGTAVDAQGLLRVGVLAALQRLERDRRMRLRDGQVQDDLDLVVHLGDYIYEGGGRDQLVRKHTGGKLASLAD